MSDSGKILCQQCTIYCQ